MAEVVAMDVVMGSGSEWRTDVRETTRGKKKEIDERKTCFVGEGRNGTRCVRRCAGYKCGCVNILTVSDLR